MVEITEKPKIIIDHNGKSRKMHPKSLANLRPWPVGNHANPNGRPKKEVCVTSWLKEYADKLISEAIDAKNLTYAQAAALSAWKAAAKGELAQYNNIVDRIEGKVGEKLDLTTKGEAINGHAEAREFIAGRISSIASRTGTPGDTIQPN